MAEKEVSGITPISMNKAPNSGVQGISSKLFSNHHAQQTASEGRVQEWAHSPYPLHKIHSRFRSLNALLLPPSTISPRPSPPPRSEEQRMELFSESTAAEQVAEDFYQRNPEMQPKLLLLLSQRVRSGDTAEQLLEKLRECYKDAFLLDQAIDFLIEMFKNDSEMVEKLRAIKEKQTRQFGREITIGRNLSAEVESFANRGIGNRSELRTLYRDITDKPEAPLSLFEKLLAKYPFAKLMVIFRFMLRSLGKELRSQQASMERAYLQQRLGEIKVMQAIRMLFAFFLVRMRLIQGQLSRHHLPCPPTLHYDLLARLFMQLLKERYPTANAILKCNHPLGIEKSLLAQTIVYTQFRDALRHVSPRLFQSERHRQELMSVLLTLLVDLEEQIEEQEEEGS